MPAASSASTACGWATRPTPGCSPRRLRGRPPTRRWRATTARWTGSRRPSPRSPRQSSTSPVRWPSTSRVPSPLRHTSTGSSPTSTARSAATPARRRTRRGRSLDNLRLRRAVVPIVEDYARLKRSRDAMDFADQMALAARLAMTFDDIGAIERARHRVVLLDEFQDTSEAQARAAQVALRRPGRDVRRHCSRGPAPVDLRMARGERDDADPVRRGVRRPRPRREARPLDEPGATTRPSSTSPTIWRARSVTPPASRSSRCRHGPVRGGGPSRPRGCSPRRTRPTTSPGGWRRSGHAVRSALPCSAASGPSSPP